MVQDNSAEGTFVQFGKHKIGIDQPVFIIAEAGVNHDGEVSVAHELIDLAAGTGANAVKFQTFNPETLVSDEAQTTPYQRLAGFADSQSDMLRRLTLPESAWLELKQHCEERSITFLSSPFDLKSAEMLAELGVPGLKIGSGELTNLPFLREVAALGIPLIVSTGMSTFEEVHDAIEATESAPGTVLLHCVSAYPAPLEEANLRVIPELRRRFHTAVGWSDHTTGSATAIAATALGSALLEKHVTTDRERVGPDHSASLDRTQFGEYVALVRATESSLGDGNKRRMPSEQDNAHLVRRSYHAIRPIRKNSVITADDVAILRPEGGLPPSAPLIGAVASRNIAASQQITSALVRMSE